MYKRRKMIFLAGIVLLLAFFCQGCNNSASSNQGNTESSEDLSTESIDTEESTEQVQDEPELLPVEAPPIGAIRIWTTTIGDEYVDAVVSVDGIEGNCDEIWKETARVKIRGNTSRYLSKKSYNIKFDEKKSLFGLDSGKKWNLLATAYEKSLLRAPIGFTYAQQIGIPYTSQFHMTELWINDVYKGVYVLIEPVQEGKNRVDIDLEEGDFLIECNFSRTEAGLSYIKTNQGIRFEINEPEEPTQEQKAAYLKWLNEAEAAIVSKDHAQYENYIDVMSFVDYYIFQEVIKDVDFGNLSTRYYCQDGKLHAGPPWDMDLTMGNVSHTFYEWHFHEYNNNMGYGLNNKDSTQGLWASKRNWYKWLCQDEYFMALVKQRWVELLPITWNLVQENELGISRMDYFLNAYRENFLRNYLPQAEGGAGWRFDKIALGLEYRYMFTSYTECEAHLRDWLKKRITWLDAQFNPPQIEESTN